MTAEARVPATIAILTFNEEARIEGCLRSLRNSGAAEILLLDNGSTDETLARVARYRDQGVGPPLRVVRTGINHLAAARQLALEKASQPWIAFIDADCLAPEGWLAGLWNAFQRHPDSHLLGVGGGNSCVTSGSAFHRALGLMLGSFLGHFGSMQAYRPPSPREVGHLSTCNVLYQRERLEAAGGFSPEFGFVCEDLELSVRAIKQGWRLLYVPGLEVAHDHRPGVVGWGRKMVRYGRGQVLVFRRHRRHGFGPKLLPFLFGSYFLITAISRPAVFAASLVAYLAFIATVSLWLAARAGSPRLASTVALLFAVTHWGYAAGEVGEVGISLIRTVFRRPRRVRQASAANQA